MKHIKLFEKYGLTSDVMIHPDIKKMVTELVGWNQGIEDCINIISTKAKSMTDKGEARSDATIKNTGDGVIVKLISEYYFGRNLPRLIDESKWQIYKKKWLVYWRGVPELRYIDNLMYNGNFTGANNYYQGTWITKNKEYALGFSDKTKPETLLEILLMPDIKLISENDLYKIQSEVLNVLQKKQNAALAAEIFDKYLYHSIIYAKEMLANMTFLVITHGFDALAIDSDICVNKEKIALTK